MGDEYALSRFTNIENHPPLSPDPIRIDGMVCVIAEDGSMSVDVNLNHYRLDRGSLLVVNRDSLLRVNDVDWDKLDCYMLYVSDEFMHDVNIDLNVLRRTSTKSVFTLPPVITLNDSDTQLMHRYLDLMHALTNANSDPVYLRSISRCIIAAIFYQLMDIATRECARLEKEDPEQPYTGRLNYAREFIQLLHQHHRSQRNLSFYASKLCITPKYLSLVVKKVTGRSASQLIDDYVLLEAKNLLRYTDMSIQQIASELNFPDQSTFGKYFKHFTGMSPSVYQKS